MTDNFLHEVPLAPQTLGKLCLNLAVKPHWMDETHFWYIRDVRRTGPDGISTGQLFVMVDTSTGHAQPAFDHARLAAALSVRLRRRRASAPENAKAAAGVAFDVRGSAEVDPGALPLEHIDFVDNGQAMTFTLDGLRWRCSLDTYRCRRDVTLQPARPHESVSPDGHFAAFLRGHNLWMRSLADGSVRQLTADGRLDDDYASRPDFYSAKTLDELSGKRLQPAILWSPDSTRILTHRLNQRGVRRLPVMQYVPEGDHAPAKARMVHYPLPGDEVLPTVTHLMVGLDGSRVDVQLDPIQIYNTDALIGPYWHNMWWSDDGNAVYFIRPTRGCKTMQFWAVDARTGDARMVLEETGDMFYDQDMRMKNSLLPDVRTVSSCGAVAAAGAAASAGAGVPAQADATASVQADAFIWPSQRDDWYHLYLHDLATGELRHPLTTGDWVVRELLSVDKGGEWVYFLGAGREPERDPYLRHLYRVRLDGSDLQLLTPEDADHDVTLSPDCRFFVDTYSRVNQPPVSVLRRSDGKLVATLEEADVTDLLAAGYQTPEPFCVKAADGQTDLYGVVIAPRGLEPGKKAPLVEYEYGGPQTGVTPKSFTVHSQWDAAVYGQSLAALGFAVMMLDGRGTPGRSKAFHHTFARLGDAAGLVDHVAALDQVAAQFDFIDRDRVGMYGFSGGGYGSARAILTWPETYKVAVACCGDHDNQLYDTTWWDRYMGDWSGVAAGADSLSLAAAPSQDNQSLAANLQGKLLLMHGDVDDNVHPALTMRVVDALIRADKDFDMLLLPNRGHALARDPYVMKRVLTYFLRNL